MENKNMKTNFTMIALFAVLALFAISFTSANLANSVTTEFNNVMLGGNEMVGSVSDTVPVRVTFVAADNASDVKIKVSIEGLKDDILESTNRFDIVAGKTYTKLLNLDLPSEDQDLTEDYTLYVQIVNTDDKTEIEYDITMQRESYTLSVLSVDYNTRVSEADVFPVSVVVKNTGFNRADDVYVIASIPALDISTRGYLGDLIPAESYDNYDDEEDSMQKTIYLQIPAEATSGLYDLVVKVYNDDSEVRTSSLISVTGSAIVDENVADDDSTQAVSTSIIALTVVLVIIFVVLLAVLVVLVTRKDKQIEEAETSYY